MKHFYTLILMLLIASTGYAASTYKSVGVYMYDGTTQYVTMESNMTASVDNDALKFVSARGEIGYPLDEVRYWSFSTDPGDGNKWTGIDGVTGDGETVRVVYTDTELSFYGLAAGSEVSVYAIDGRLVNAGRSNEDSCYSIDLGGLATGVYVVRYGDHTLKIAVK